MNAHVISTGDRASVTYVWFGWDTVSVPVTPPDNTSVYTVYPHYFISIGPYVSGDDFYGTSGTPLSPGTRYYFRAAGTNGEPPPGSFPLDRWSFGDEMSFLTRPQAPANLNRTIVSNSQIDLTWTKGDGANRTKLLRKTGDYPSNYDDADATVVYFDTGTSCSDTGLSLDTTLYYYRAWSEVTDGSDQQWSSSYVQTASFNRPTVTTTSFFNVTSTNFWMSGNITDLGGQNCDKRGFYFGTNSIADPGSAEPSAGYNLGGGWSGGSFGTGSFQAMAQHPSISPGVKYYFRACAHNMAGWGWGNEMAVITRPGAPSSLSATGVSPIQVDLTWSKGTGSLNTKILRKTDSYPTDENDGTIIYFDTGTSCQDTGLSPGVTYYYRAFAEQNDFGGGGSLQSFSSTASQATATTSAFIPTANVDSAKGTGNVVFTTSNGSILNLTASSSAPCGSISDFSFPHGFFSYTVDYIPVGSSVTVTITLPSSMPVDTQAWKCVNGKWINCTAILGDNNGDNILTLTLTDGGPYDADGLANGVIVDPVGFGVALVTVPTPASVPAYAIDNSPVPTLTVRQPARITTKYISVQPQVAQVGQPITIATNIVNEGEESGHFTVVLKVNGQVVEKRTGVLSGRSAAPVEFTVIENQPGTYSIDINGKQESFSLIKADSRSNTPSIYSTLFIIIAALVISIAVLFLTVRIRRSH